MANGVHVATTEGSTTSRPLTAIQSHTFRISHPTWQVQPSSPKLAWFAPTARFPYMRMTLPRLPLLLLFGLYEFCRMPFGLRNAAQTFQRFIDDVCRGLDFVFIYLDDILVASRSREEHLQHLRALFHRLSAHGLVIDPAKCLFGKNEVNFLSHTISADGIRPHIARVDAVRSFPVPHNKKSLHQFVGLINYYHRFVPRCVEILQPLHQALAADSFTWSTSCQKAFEEAKQTLSEAVMLVHPQPQDQCVKLCCRGCT